MIAPVRLIHLTGHDRVAVVSVAAATAPEAFLVKVARGPRQGKLTGGTTYGPFPEEELAARFAQVVAALVAEGFQQGGGKLLLDQLGSSSPKVRARTALRLGWMQVGAAVGPMVAALGSATSDAPSLIDALGELGDPAAAPALRGYAERKLLSRRRSAVEALRKVGDAEGLTAALGRGLERLPDAVRAAVATIDEANAQAFGPIVKAILSRPAKERGLALDTIYERGTPACVGATQALVAEVPIGEVGMWRYVKSVFKRAILRHDFATFGLLAHRIEVRGREFAGSTAIVKSGLDGEERKTQIFSRRTQRFMKRLAWRYLRKLARWRPDRYTAAAAEALVPYRPADARSPKGLYGEWASSHVLHKILFGASTRFKPETRALKYRFKSSAVTDPPAQTREESHPELWDLHARPFVRLLSASSLPLVHRFANREVARAHRKVLETATMDELRRMLAAPYEPTVALGLGELSRRFDLAKPDWLLLDQLLGDERPVARELGLRWLKLTAHLWARDVERLLGFYAHADGAVRAVVDELAISALAGAPGVRAVLADRVLAILRAPEATTGDHDRFARLATEALAPELAGRLTVAELLELIASGSVAARGVAGFVLGRKPDAFAELTMPRVLALAENEIAAVRASAIVLLEAMAAELHAQPKLLFALAESPWPDVRRMSVAILRGCDWTALGLDGVIGLCDSNHAEIQALGRQLALDQLAVLDVSELLWRLSQHPNRDMRRFALELVEQHLGQGFVPLARLELFFRAALFDAWPQREMKRRALALLAARGLRDEWQAEFAVAILDDFVRTAVRADFDLAIQALVAIKLAFPGLETVIGIPEVAG